MMSPSIVAVDDSSTVRLQLRRLLTAAGYEVSVVSSGKEAISLLQSKCPDLLILDIQMPDVDGYTVCQELMRLGSPWDALPIIFLTSLESHALSLLGNEMGAYLRKPVCSDELLGTVARFLRPGRSPETRARRLAEKV